MFTLTKANRQRGRINDYGVAPEQSSDVGPGPGPDLLGADDLSGPAPAPAPAPEPAPAPAPTPTLQTLTVETTFL